MSSDGDSSRSDAASCGSVCAEARTILRLALPMCIQAIAWAMQPLTMLFISRYGTDVIAGAGLGYMWTAVTGESLIYGSGMGLATLSSQAFGAKNYRRVGLLWQRQCTYQWCICVITATLWWNTEAIMLSLGQPPRVVANAAIWCRWQLHGLPAVPVLNSLNVFLGSQRIVRPAAIISTVTTFVITVPAIYLLTQPERMGFKGAPFAIAAGQLLQAGTLRIVAPRVVKHPSWIPWSMEAMHGWWELFKLGIGGAVGLWAEWWAAELMVFMAGILCTVTLKPDDACAAVAVTVLLRNFGMPDLPQTAQRASRSISRALESSTCM
jgi:MATE family multidrug resistance protein